MLTFNAKEAPEYENPYAVGQTGLIGNPAANAALEMCDVLMMIGTDFPYRQWYPQGKKVIQLDTRVEHIGRRTGVDISLTGQCRPALRALLAVLTAHSDDEHLSTARKEYQSWCTAQSRLAYPRHEHTLLGRLRRHVDNPQARIRPEALAAALDRHAADDTIFTSDTGMSTVWLSRLIPMTGHRQLLGSYNLGSMANALPQALGAQVLDRDRYVVALSGDGGLMMLLGDLRTAVSYNLPITVIVFDNGCLGMVKLEQERRTTRIRHAPRQSRYRSGRRGDGFDRSTCHRPERSR